MSCLFAMPINVNGKLTYQTYTCEQVRNLNDKWLKEYKEKNRVQDENKDKSFIDYKNNIYFFLATCNCKKHN